MKATHKNVPLDYDQLMEQQDARLARKTDQINGVKMLLAMTVLIGGIMETELPQPGVSDLELNCPIVKTEVQDGKDRYELSRQRCVWLARM